MTDAPETPDTTPPAPEATPLTLAEAVGKKLTDAPAPLKFADVKKGLTKAKKQSAEDFEAEIRNLLAAEVEANRVFVAPSGKDGENRYWAKDETHAIQSEAFRLAETPTPLAELSKKAGAVAKGADAGFVDTVLQGLITGHKLFEHPPKKPDGPGRFGTTEFRHPNDTPAVTAALTAAATMIPAKDLIKSVAGATKADKEFVATTLDDLLAAGQLHKHPSKKPTGPVLIGTEPYRHPNDTPVVTAALVAAATMIPSKDLIKSVTETTKADKEFVATTLDSLIAAGQLHKHPSKKPTGPVLIGTEPYRHPNDTTTVNAALLAATDTPTAIKELVKTVEGTTGADKEFITAAVDELLAAGQLYLHAPAKGKTTLVGREKQDPLYLLDIEPGKKTFAALVAAADKVVKAAAGAPLDAILHRLRTALEDRAAHPPAAEQPAEPSGEGHHTPHRGEPAPTHPVEHTAHP